MKRGRQYPHTRAPWSVGGVRPTDWGPPSHVSSNNHFQFIADPTHPDDITHIDADYEFARWSYQQNNSAIVWYVDWVGDDPSYFGSFVWKQIPHEDNELCTARLTIVFVYVGTVPYATTFSIDANAEGSWPSPTFGFGQQYAHYGFHDPRLIFYNIGALTAMDYQTMEDHGLDSHDTSPVTWDY